MRTFYFSSGFMLCGAFKVAFEGEWLRAAFLLAVATLCLFLANDLARLTNSTGGE